ncbi:unnamed protein product [Rotaria socialis]|uniref:Uncharacterized protein n=1 Tax=Rotaria socialis TaxID=392032 RepID=A0A820PE34_9BILA|nr:unnamed protein product [Rotaria socialis]
MASPCTEFRVVNEDNLAEWKEQHDNHPQNQYAVVDEIWIRSFVNDALNVHKLKTIDSIEPIPFKFLTKNLKRKLECGPKDFHTKRTCSQRTISDLDWSDIGDIECQLTYTTVKV